jgi:acylphosphatase
MIFSGVFEGIDTFFQVERHGKQNRLHGIVVTLVGGRLRVSANRHEEAVKMFLVSAAQGSPEFRPMCRGVFNKLHECRDGAAHGDSPSRSCLENCGSKLLAGESHILVFLLRESENVMGPGDQLLKEQAP